MANFSRPVTVLRRSHFIFPAIAVAIGGAAFALRAEPASPPTVASTVAPTVASTVAYDGEPLKLDIDGRPQDLRIDLARAFTVDLDFRAESGRLSAFGLDQVKKLAGRLAREQRYIVLVSNDDYSPSGRAGKAGFDRAKAIREALVDDKTREEDVIVAGWRAASTDPGLLSILIGAGRVVIAPVLFAAPTSTSADGKDLGRAVAFDSATSRLTVATAVPPPVSGLGTPGPAPTVIPASIPPGAEPSSPVVAPTPTPGAIAVAPPLPKSVDAPVSTTSTAEAPRAPKPKPTLAPTPAIAEEAAPKTIAPAEVERCERPTDDLDDYYPGGPLVPCGAPYPKRTSR